MKTDLLKVLSDMADYAIIEKYDGNDFHGLLDGFRNSEVFNQYRPKYRKIVNGLRGKKSWSVAEALFRKDEHDVMDYLTDVNYYPETLKFVIGGRMLILPVWQDREGTCLRRLSYQLICLIIKMVLGSNLISDSYEHYRLFKRYRNLLNIAYPSEGRLDGRGIYSSAGSLCGGGATRDEYDYNRKIRTEEYCEALKMKMGANIEPGFRLWLAESMMEIAPSDENICRFDEIREQYPECVRNGDYRSGSVSDRVEKALVQLKDVQQQYLVTARGRTDSSVAHAYINTFLDYLSSELSNHTGFNDTICNRAEYVFIDMYGLMRFRRIHRYSRNNLVAAAVICGFLNEDDDYSLPCLLLCRAVENDFNHRIIYPMVDAYESIAAEKNIKSDNRQANRFYLYDFSFRKKHDDGSLEKEQFTLATLAVMSGYSAAHGGNYNQLELENRKLDWQSFKEIVAEIMSIPSERAEKMLEKTVPMFAEINSDFRRGAAHPANRISKDVYDECFEKVCGKESIFEALIELDD